ncbi:9946_t:CDS:2 [Ambispora leptoticha]|uniref:9946_t:CDS:1 n=1 Tax=Ambispora leptoticha TaxID=144679 RepID=A0A9N9DJY2_9GLOM|nr:9946_t:CDS:2 [Ambispora leptoticha]
MASKPHHLLEDDDNVDIAKNGVIIRYDDMFVKDQSTSTKTKKRAHKTIAPKFAASSSNFSSISSAALPIGNKKSLVKVTARPKTRYVNLEKCLTFNRVQYNRFRELGNLAVSSFLNPELNIDSQNPKTLKNCKKMIFSSYPALFNSRDSWVVDVLVHSILMNKRRYLRQRQQQKEKAVLSGIEHEFAKNQIFYPGFIEESNSGDSGEEETESEKETSEDDKKSKSSMTDLSEEENEYSGDEGESKTENGDKDILEEMEVQIVITNEEHLENKETDCGYEIVVSLPATDEEDETDEIENDPAKRLRVEI